MRGKPRFSPNDILNLLVAGSVASFSTVIGGSLLVGLASQPEEPEEFLVLLAAGMVLGGAGCGLYCLHVWMGRLFKSLYAAALVLTVAGYGLAAVAQAMYERQ